MKYWWGYLTAAIFAVISWALMQFAKTHGILVDMIYPYVTRLIINYLVDWTSGFKGLVWQTVLIAGILLAIGAIAWMIWKRKNPIRWIGWGLAVISLVFFLNTALYGLNAYTGPLADDLHLDVADYTVTELNETAVFFRDKANALAMEINRDEEGQPDIGSFEILAEKAGEGYENLTYEQAMSVFAGSTAPVKKWKIGAPKGNSGMTVALTGEAAVNPKVPAAALPFAMCKEMAHRMTIYSEADANFSAFLAGIHNPSPVFQYSAYLMAYHYCYEALASVPTSTAQACAKETDKGVSALLRQDLEDCIDFYGETEVEPNIRTSDKSSDEETSLPVDLTFSSYSDVSDLLASWYIQNYILPMHQEEEDPFDPFDPAQVDLSGIANAKKDD